ncbi:hypothetical protein B9J80_05510 [Vibrio sp. V12_P9A6T4]|uniref:DUF2971 domain-containing protein n=1 Tax=Vibrio sp. V12_P9A6T4 TaxID=1938667 RepID=UPI000B8E244F|nr:DUF2971 domain-containing protein [Vibrio sp. V12_P9A6T4]OXX55468.1 hypothetical protein B9J80_05510 [Vibrio sp. V12_P9A6T4]
MKEFEPLYKFRGVDEYSLNSIEENTLWFSHVDDFNDPFELFYKITSGIDEDNITDAFDAYLTFAEKQKMPFAVSKKAILSAVSTVTDDVKSTIINMISQAILPLQMAKIERVKNDNKIFSLSFSNEHPLLWGHYANGLKGMCIEYDLNRQRRPLNLGYCPVEYLDEPYTINLLDFLKYNHGISSYSEKIFATKNKVWAYEEEFRLISENDVMSGNKYKLNDDVIRSIILGEKMPMEDQLKVKSVIAGRDIKLYKAIAVPSDFRIDIVEYEI